MAHGSYLALFLTFLRFGFLAWGGPVAQINMIREELVEKQGWITPDKFKRALAVYQALPGPEAHELCVYFGMIRMGRWGGFLAGLGFMLPGLVFILLLAWAYSTLGAATLLPLFIGVAPAVTALIVRAFHRIAQHTLDSQPLWIAAILAAVLTLVGVHFLLVFIICAAWQALWVRGNKRTAIIVLIALTTSTLVFALMMNKGAGWSFASGGGLLIEGLKAGLLSFGGAYTALPFLQDSMVGVYPNITQQTFLDGIALSNVIPAPLVIFGTFLGYMADGVAGALLMTLGIFVPAFAFTLIGHNWLEKAIENRALHGVLDGISAAVVGLLGVTAFEIALHTLTSFWSIAIFCLALAGFYLLRGKWHVPAVIISCGIIGYLLL